MIIKTNSEFRIQKSDIRIRVVAGICLLAALTMLISPAFSQEDFPHPELSWHTIESDHFLVHYHDGAERTARVVSKIAEDIYEPITSLYNHKPDQKVSLIIKDYDDISNGAAYFYDNKIDIFAPSMDFELRGTHNWLRNVITHEFTHIVQIQTSMKYGRRMPALYLQWLNYEAERRVDVLYGYPNVVASYPLSGFVVPAWFAEGVAQFNHPDLAYDFWDTHRDMILRSYALDGNMLSWEQMGVFGKTSLGNESSYNAGFAFIGYLVKKYGMDKVKEISYNLASFTALTIDGAIERAVGRGGKEIYDEWRAALEADYAARVAPMKASLQQGHPLEVEEEMATPGAGETQKLEGMLIPRSGASTPAVHATLGFANLYPVFSPDGKHLAYTSAKNADYFVSSSLFVYDFSSKKETLIQPGVRTAPAWSPDGSKLYYARATRDNPHWSFQFDIFEYDLKAEHERRITFGKRAINPAVSPDGKQIVYVTSKDGTSNLVRVNLDGTGSQQITPYANAEQVYNPCWSATGDRILFDYSIKDGRDIAWVHPDGTGLEFLVADDDDSRAARFSMGDSTFVFCSDRSGIFNVYEYSVTTRQITQLTNVLGGAFYPTMSVSGRLAYAAYTSGGYKIYSMDVVKPVADNSPTYLRRSGVPTGKSPNIEQIASAAGGGSSVQGLRHYDDQNLKPLEQKSYKPVFGSTMFVPVIRVDNYNPKSKGVDVVKVGLFLFSNDVLEKTGFFAGATLNRKLERDLFLQFTYRGRIPLLYELGFEPTAYAELYNITRKTDNVISLPAYSIPVDVDYNLLEFDLALRQPIISQFIDAEFRWMHSRYTSAIGSFFTQEDVPQLIGSSSDLYLIANDLSLTFTVDAIVPARTQDISPMGRRVMLHVMRELNKFNGDGEYTVTSTGLTPVYKNVNFTRLEAQWKEYMPFFFKNHTLTVKLRGGTIFGPPVDEFFDFYAGGLVGMKGYPFYALGGNEMATVGLEYRFPLVQSIDFRVAQLYFDKLYASVYADAGDAWTGYSPRLDKCKTDAGVELRLESFSYYSYPTRIFLNASYGFNKFDHYIASRDQNVTYGGEWRFYFGILFGFDFD
jgi:Tol biopolymer transport system component